MGEFLKGADLNNIIKNMFVNLCIFFLAVAMLIGKLIAGKGHFKQNPSFIGAILLVIAVEIVLCIPYFADLKQKQTITFEGVFLYDASEGGFDGRAYYFDTNGNGEQDNYFESNFLNGSKYVPKEGKRYRVVVYKHSHTIYSLELLE